ncbi:uncharacterized protein LOC131938230 [Physella acuta]|uniref:uncharacterized protein LOC131938230 n=1 Tax=Physella acuta TaxID=109671 RepID=UPI0027DBE6BD|nr:uncharacterized protein LOC131938230 [Physella acuta]
MNTVDNVDTYAYVYCNCTKVCKTGKNQVRLDTEATTNQACFQACSNNPRCFLYDYYQGACKLYGADGDAVDTVTNQNTQAFVYCTCDTAVSDTTQNPATTTETATTTPAAIELEGCFKACFVNPRCFMVSFDGEEGICENNVADGDVVTSTVNSQAYVYCEACDETTTTATTTTTITTKTTRAPAQRYYDCHSCTSGCSSKKQNYLCPANGKIKTGTNTRFARCKGPCMSTVNKTPFGGDVVRGCSDGKFPGLRIPANGCLTHKKGVTCFCTGDRCNTRNMVQEQSRMGNGWWIWRGHH